MIEICHPTGQYITWRSRLGPFPSFSQKAPHAKMRCFHQNTDHSTVCDAFIADTVYTVTPLWNDSLCIMCGLNVLICAWIDLPFPLTFTFWTQTSNLRSPTTQENKNKDCRGHGLVALPVTADTVGAWIPPHVLDVEFYTLQWGRWGSTGAVLLLYLGRSISDCLKVSRKVDISKSCTK